MYVKGGRCDGTGRRIRTPTPAGCSVVRENAATHPPRPRRTQCCAGKRSHPPSPTPPDAVLCGKTQPPTLPDPAGRSVVRENAATHPPRPRRTQCCAGKRSHPPSPTPPDAVLCGKTQPPALPDPAGRSVVRENAATRPPRPRRTQCCAGKRSHPPCARGQSAWVRRNRWHRGRSGVKSPHRKFCARKPGHEPGRRILDVKSLDA